MDITHTGRWWWAERREKEEPKTSNTDFFLNSDSDYQELELFHKSLQQDGFQPERLILAAEKGMEIIDKSTWFTNANSANSAAAPEQPGLQTVLPPSGLVQLCLFIEESKMIFFWVE